MNIKILFCTCLLFTVQFLFSQGSKKQIPFDASYWNYDRERTEFVSDQDHNIMKARDGGGRYYLKDEVFKNGTIEFEVDLKNGGFTGIYFRENEIRSESEYFYVRAFWPVSEQSRTTLQYCTVYDSVSLWDMTDDYQASASITREGWNKIKLVVSENQLLAYVNDMENPAMHVPVLEGKHKSGLISFTGNGAFRNFYITPEEVGDLTHEIGYDPVRFDTRYLKEWEHSEPFEYLAGREIIGEDLPDSTAVWKPISAEYRGQIMLNEKYGAAKNRERRFIWLRTTVHSEVDQVRRLDLGFSDEVWVILNNDLLYVDKNLYGSVSMKEPKGRCSIENTSISVPLKKGENEIIIGLANDFFGWGMVARFDDTLGLSFK